VNTKVIPCSGRDFKRNKYPPLIAKMIYDVYFAAAEADAWLNGTTEEDLFE
jgi:hypothetical protein